MIYILLFVSVISTDWGVYPVNWNGNPPPSQKVVSSIEICQSLDEVNKRVNEEKPEKVYSYNIETHELKEMKIDFYRVVKESEK